MVVKTNLFMNFYKKRFQPKNWTPELMSEQGYVAM